MDSYTLWTSIEIDTRWSQVKLNLFENLGAVTGGRITFQLSSYGMGIYGTVIGVIYSSKTNIPVPSPSSLSVTRVGDLQQKHLKLNVQSPYSTITINTTINNTNRSEAITTGIIALLPKTAKYF